MYRFRVPEIFLGCILTVAVFATGMLFERAKQTSSPTQSVSHREAATESQNAQSPDAELTGSAWLTKDAGGFFTFGLVIVGIGQAVLFFFQLSYMRTGMDDAAIAASAAKESADTAKIQAEVAHNTLITMQDTAQRQLRAYLVVEPRTIENFEAGMAATGHFCIRNVGQTPPHDVVMATGVEIARYPPLPAFGKPSAEALMAGPNARRGYFANSVEVAKDAERAFSQSEIDAVIAGRSRLYVGGRVYYKDVFNNEWYTDFLHAYYGPKTRTMIPEQCETGNEAT
jgi:hypothetical protein